VKKDTFFYEKNMLWENLGFGCMQQNTIFIFLKKSFFL